MTTLQQVKQTAMSSIEDIIETQINFFDEFKFILDTIYVLQRIPYKDLSKFLTIWLIQCSNLVDYLGLTMLMVLVNLS